jgi:hypothetical protein
LLLVETGSPLDGVRVALIEFHPVG